MSTKDLAKDESPTVTNVLDLNKFRAKKAATGLQGSGRLPLMTNHTNDLVKSSPHFGRPAESQEFTDRIARIRDSLEKINSLMAELKKQSAAGKSEASRAKPDHQD